MAVRKSTGVSLPRAPKGVRRTTKKVQAWIHRQAQLPVADQDAVFRKLRQQIREASSTRTIPRSAPLSAQDLAVERLARTRILAKENPGDPRVRAMAVDELFAVAIKATRFTAGRPESAATAHIHDLVRGHEGETWKVLMKHADSAKIRGMSESTFRNHVTAARKRLNGAK
jgi:hypothetical protein